MRYGLVLNFFAPSPEEQAGRLAVFLSANSFDAEDGTVVILYDPDSVQAPLLRSAAAPLPAERVYCIAAREYIPEEFLVVLEELLADVDCILFPGSYFGDELAVRLAARRNGSSLTEVLSLCAEEEQATARKKIYAGHVIGTFALRRRPYVVSIDKNAAFSGAPERSAKEPEWFYIDPDRSAPVCEIEKQPFVRDSVLEDASCVAVGGRGLENGENAKQLSRLAQNVSIPFAGSRPCVMNAWLPMSRLIGVSGTQIAPDLCILLGTSGAPALYSGVEKSGKIIAVNTDADAPVMKKADLAIRGDCVAVFQNFVEIVEEEQNADKFNTTDIEQS